MSQINVNDLLKNIYEPAGVVARCDALPDDYTDDAEELVSQSLRSMDPPPPPARPWAVGEAKCDKICCSPVGHPIICEYCKYKQNPNGWRVVSSSPSAILCGQCQIELNLDEYGRAYCCCGHKQHLVTETNRTGGCGAGRTGADMTTWYCKCDKYIPQLANLKFW